MSVPAMLVWLSPLLLLIGLLGVTFVIGVVRARPEDIPAVLKEGGTTLCRLAARLPFPRGASTSENQISGSTPTSGDAP